MKQVIENLGECICISILSFLFLYGMIYILHAL